MGRSKTPPPTEPKTETVKLYDQDRVPAGVGTAFVLLTALSSLLYLTLFSRFFALGHVIYTKTDKFGYEGSTCFTAAITLVAILYFLDFSYWRGAAGTAMRRVCSFVFLVLILCSCIFFAHFMPYLPMLCFLILMQVQAIAMRAYFFPNVNMRSALQFFSTTYVVLAAITLLAWVMWLNGYWPIPGSVTTADNHWSLANRATWSDQLGCTEDYRTGSICLAAFMLWASPVVLVGSFLILAAAIQLFRTLIKGNDTAEVDLSGASDDVQKIALQQAAKQEALALGVAKGLLVVIVIAFVGMWTAAAMSGAGMRLANMVFAICMVIVIAVVVLGICAIGTASLTSSLTGNPTVKALYEAMHGDWFHAAIFFFGFPLFLLFVPVSFVNQCVRKLGALCAGGPIKAATKPKPAAATKPKQSFFFGRASNPKSNQVEEETRDAFSIGHAVGDAFDGGAKDEALLAEHKMEELEAQGKHARFRRSPFKPLTEKEMKLPLTLVAHNLVNSVAGWNWGKVLMLDCYIAMIIWVVKVGTILTFISLSALVEALQTVPCAAVSIIFFGVGIIMFLIPVVPAQAVYLTAGVLLVPICGMEDGKYNNFPLALLWACFMAYVMKLVGHMMQQKVFGEGMGTQVSIRAMVGVNSPTIKTVHYILKQKGITKAKVFVLCGGPDWPTSVLCGILKLNVWQTTLGLTPVVVLTTPVVLASAFQTRVNDGQTWESAATVVLMFTTVLQVGAMLGAMHFLESTRIAHQKEISEIPDDEEVAELETAQAYKDTFFNKISTSLRKMPALPLASLFTAVILLNISGYMLILAASALFEPFSLTDDVDDVMCVGCERALVKNAGGFAIGLLLAGAFTLEVWKAWAKSEAAKLMVEAGGPGDNIKQQAPKKGK